MPPRLPPITAAQQSICKCSISSFCDSTSLWRGGEVGAPDRAGIGIHRGWSGTAKATAYIVDTDHIKFIGIYGFYRGQYNDPTNPP